MIGSLPPGSVLILGALLVPLLRGRSRQACLLALPILSFAHLLALPSDPGLSVSMFDYTLTLVRMDRLSLVFGYIFHLAAFLGVIYALQVKEAGEHAAALVYMGSAIGGVFAGDLVTLFVYWELTAIASVFLIWSRRTPQALRAGLRYLAVQVGSGVILLAGVVLHVQKTGSIAFVDFDCRQGIPDMGTGLILLAFGIKCAFPFLHNWLQDAYPEATVTGTVFLSAFTTKLAVYSLARGFPGTDLLVPIGTAMAVFPIFYAVIENDLRRVLAYSLNNQLGFMVVGIGLADLSTPVGQMALNGAVAHAVCDILFKAVLFMAMGAVLLRAGTVKGSELGGLYKSMPWTTAFCIVGAASISAFPLFSAFVSKSLVMAAAADQSRALTWFALLFASAGVFHHAGIKIPFFAFFGHDSGIRCKEAPLHMLIAMGLAAALCVGIGVCPGPLYGLLPYPEPYRPYTTGHVITQLQLLCLSALAFAILKRTGLYPPELRSTNLDTDWFYRRFPQLLWEGIGRPAVQGLAWCQETFLVKFPRAFAQVAGPGAGGGKAPESWPIGRVVATSVLMLLAYLLVVFFQTRAR